MLTAFLTREPSHAAAPLEVDDEDVEHCSEGPEGGEATVLRAAVRADSSRESAKVFNRENMVWCRWACAEQRDEWEGVLRWFGRFYVEASRGENLELGWSISRDQITSSVQPHIPARIGDIRQFDNHRRDHKQKALYSEESSTTIVLVLYSMNVR